MTKEKPETTFFLANLPDSMTTGTVKRLTSVSHFAIIIIIVKKIILINN